MLINFWLRGFWSFSGIHLLFVSIVYLSFIALWFYFDGQVHNADGNFYRFEHAILNFSHILPFLNSKALAKQTNMGDSWEFSQMPPTEVAEENFYYLTCFKLDDKWERWTWINDSKPI